MSEQLFAQLGLISDDVVIHRFNLDKASLVIGRGADSDILLDDQSVSSRHAEIRYCIDETQGRESILAKDLNSTNGTFVNQEKISEHPLKHNDLLQVGSKVFKVLATKGCDATTLLKASTLIGNTKLSAEDKAKLDLLTQRELDVLNLIGSGLQRKSIARELNLSVHTVSDHIKTIYRKLEISSKQEASRFVTTCKN